MAKTTIQLSDPIIPLYYTKDEVLDWLYNKEVEERYAVMKKEKDIMNYAVFLRDKLKIIEYLNARKNIFHHFDIECYLQSASANGMMDVIELLFDIIKREKEEYIFSFIGKKAAFLASNNGHLNVFKFLHDNGIKNIMYLECAKAAASNGHKNCLEYILDICHEIYQKALHQNMTINEMMNIHPERQDYSVYDNTDITDLTARSNHLDLLKMALDKGCIIDEEAIHISIRNDAIECFYYLETVLPYDIQRALNISVNYGRTKILRFLLEKHDMYIESTLYNSIRQNKFQCFRVIKMIAKKKKINIMTEYTMKCAMEYDTYDTFITYLCKENCPFPSSDEYIHFDLIEGNHEYIMKVLKQIGYNINPKIYFECIVRNLEKHADFLQMTLRNKNSRFILIFNNALEYIFLKDKSLMKPKYLKKIMYERLNDNFIDIVYKCHCFHKIKDFCYYKRIHNKIDFCKNEIVEKTWEPIRFINWCLDIEDYERISSYNT